MKMLGYLFLLVVFIYVVVRKTNDLEIVPANSFIVDEFEKCNNDTNNYFVPLTYVIESFSDIRVKLVSKNLTLSDQIDYKLEKMVLYKINLEKHYHKINGSCSVVTINDNNFPVMIRRRYEYQPLLKYLFYISSKEYDSYVSCY